MWDKQTYLYRAEDPQNQRLKDDQGRRSNPKGKVNAQVLADIRVRASPFVYLIQAVRLILHPSEILGRQLTLAQSFNHTEPPVCTCISVPIINARSLAKFGATQVLFRGRASPGYESDR